MEPKQPPPAPVEPAMDQQVTLIGAARDRAVWRYSGDTGAMGSGSNPDYLVCGDGAGRKIWSFPRFESGPRPGASERERQHWWIRWRAAGVGDVLVLGDEDLVLVLLGGEKAPQLHGIRLSDGHSLWHRNVPKIAARMRVSDDALQLFDSKERLLQAIPLRVFRKR